MKKLLLVSVALLLSAATLNAQVSVTYDGNAPDNSAMLEVKSNEKGFLPPRMTSGQIESIMNPADGLIVYSTTDSRLYVYIGRLGQWKEVDFGAGILTPPFSCGIPLTINHLAGNVAPVTKTTTYGTIGNIPGEPAKCWITSNLGSDHQASSASDATEASAGWYWQFNRKQGFKNDGINLTPAWPFSGITEDLNWLSENDPCTIELGNEWRLPTSSEWNNVDAGGNWEGLNDTWSSPLKFHAAGYLDWHDGSLEVIGTGGYAWGSTQLNSTSAYYLHVYQGSYMQYGNKTHGFTLRCLREITE